MLAERIDEFGKPLWIGLLILSFVLFWPAGFVLLGYLIGSGRMGCWTHGGHGWQRNMDRMQRRMDRMQDRVQQAAGRWWGPRPAGRSGNWAFDDYREATLRRLEDEQREFMEFLDRLRHAKDKVEFDQFMAERGRRTNGAPEAPQP